MAASMNTWVGVSCRRLRAVRGHSARLWLLKPSCSIRGCQPSIFFATNQPLSVIRRSKVKKHVTKVTADEPILQEALTEFAFPKQTLNNLLQLSGIAKPRSVLSYETKHSKQHSLWQTSLHLRWPQNFSVVGQGRKKADSERAAAVLACSHLKAIGVLNEDGTPGGTTSTNDRSVIQKHLQKSSLPEYVQLPEDLKQRIQSLQHQEPEEHMEERMDWRFADEFSSLAEGEDPGVADVITGRPYQEYSEEHMDQRSGFLYDRWRQARNVENKARLLADQLPIALEREKILSVLENNRVAVLCGDTGCGKTTQVPQFILDQYLERREGARCNIVVTQPRRISAISVAERVAEERGEIIGETVGYQVRLKSALPYHNGCALFCTTGILLKKLQSNPTLQGISHVIVDEVHERDMNTDFLLVLLKSALNSNPDLSLLLMSASINAEMFSEYFDGCPLIMVPGRMYPVQEYFLPEVLERISRFGSRRSLSSSLRNGEEEDPETDHDAVVDLVKYLDEAKPQGAILVFLPGWQDIKTVNDRLQEIWQWSDRHEVHPVHSSIPLSEQRRIFHRPPEGCRKIVLATNIAETSITIDDVVYVVNTGSHKEQRYKMNLGVSCLDLFWISKANVKQRKGRAGRCQPGECYHLFTPEMYQRMDDYEVPEILRVPLEQIIVMSKIHSPHVPAVDFLSRALQPPATETVERAVVELQELGILDEKESLTFLGQKISHMSTEPRLAKALVMSAIFRCVNPVLTVAARLGSREPFRDSMDNRPAVQKIRSEFAGSTYSDHLMSVNLFRRWFDARQMGHLEGSRFEESFMIHRSTLFFLKGLRQQFADNLEEAGLVVSGRDSLLQLDSSSEFDDGELVKSVLLGAFFPNIIKASVGKFKKRKLQMKKLSFKDHNSHRLLLSRRSVNAAEKKFPSRWFTYFSKMQSGEIFIHDTSMVHPLAPICFSNQPVTCTTPSLGEVETVSELLPEPIESDWSEIVRMTVADASGNSIGSFYATEDTANALMKLRAHIQAMMDDVLALDSRSDMSPSMYQRHTDLLEILVDVLNTKQALFMKLSKEKGSNDSLEVLQH